MKKYTNPFLNKNECPGDTGLMFCPFSDWEFRFDGETMTNHKGSAIVIATDRPFQGPSGSITRMVYSPDTGDSHAITVVPGVTDGDLIPFMDLRKEAISARAAIDERARELNSGSNLYLLRDASVGGHCSKSNFLYLQSSAHIGGHAFIDSLQKVNLFFTESTYFQKRWQQAVV